MSDTYRRYRVLWPDQFGLPRGKYLPAAAVKRGAWFSSAVFMQSYDRNLYSVEVALRPAGLPDLEAHCPLAEARPGWEPDTGVIVADLYYGKEPYPISPRNALRSAVRVWHDQGIQPLIGASLTGYVLQPDSEGGWEPITTPSAYLYGTGALADPTGLLYEIMATAESCGLAIESVSTDLDTPQFEIVIPMADAVSAIDSVFLVRELARELANERDLKVTFLPKPLPDKGGNGMQISVSLFDQAGDNKLFDSDAPDGLSSLTRTAIGGILRHHEGLTALAAPTVNSYKRFRGGDIIGTKPTWGYDHRFATVRVPPLRGQGTRFQHRLADAAANPYLLAAGLLHAARLGDKSRVNPGKSLNDHREGDGDDGRTLPDTLEAAVEALRGDGELTAALGPQLVDNFCQLKMIEWNNFVDAEPRWADKIDEFSE
ncbi:MAG: glutamine synthetase family protein, partial [Acidimicrobiia bacterium]|nr:glutamine synthetase family protein [Acidimicrobiia bacterium]